MSDEAKKPEVDRVIEELECSINVAHLEFWMSKNYSNFKLHKETIEYAITAIKQIEAVRAECVKYFDSRYNNNGLKIICDPISAYRNMAKEILEILEGRI